MKWGKLIPSFILAVKQTSGHWSIGFILVLKHETVVLVEFPAMSLVKLPNGQILSVLVRFDENGRPLFGISEEIMKMFVEEAVHK